MIKTIYNKPIAPHPNDYVAERGCSTIIILFSKLNHPQNIQHYLDYAKIRIFQLL